MKKLVLGSMILLGAVLPVLANNVKTLPPEIYGQLKRGKELDLVYKNPKFDPATGFTIGSITTKIDEDYEGPYADTLQYFPTPLGRLVIADSPNVLDLVVTNLQITDMPGRGLFTADIKVEGQIKGPDGTLLMAFVTEKEIGTRESVRADCSGVMDAIAWQLYRDMGPKFIKAMEDRAAGPAANLPKNVILVPKSAQASPATQQGPMPPAAPLDVQGRLMRLDDLLKKGLITPEEYKTHKEAILNSL